MGLSSFHTRYLVPAAIAAIALLVLGGIVRGFSQNNDGSGSLRIATTTSLDDSGLLEEILPAFEQEYAAGTDVIAVGTGQALMLGERGDVDIVLVHAPALEEEFLAGGYGVERVTSMTNQFIIVGPEDDPAGVRDATDAPGALRLVAEHQALFVSRGDDSGTHARELEIWETLGHHPDAEDDWYFPAGQGMGETLLTAQELEAYSLTDRATYVAMGGDSLSDLTPLYGLPKDSGAVDPLLENPYSAIVVNPENRPESHGELARSFAEWFNADGTRARIAGYGKDTFDEPLFTLIEEE